MDLSERHRPRRFDQLWQWPDTPSLTVIRNELARGRLQTPILITGGYGEAKTTLARIIGRRASCMNPSSHPYEPCGACDGCLRLDQICTGSMTWNEFGYLELDCTQYPVAQLREIVRQYTCGKLVKTTFRRWVVCLDEIGRCDGKYQRGLLKFIEDVRVHIIFCAADRDSVDVALRERCAIRPLTVPTPPQCVRGVLRVASAESFQIAEHSASLLVTRLGCNPRRILKTLQTAVALANGTVSVDHIETALSMTTT